MTQNETCFHTSFVDVPSLCCQVLFLGGYAYFAGGAVKPPIHLPCTHLLLAVSSSLSLDVATDFYKKVADWQTQPKIDFYMNTLSLCFCASIAVLFWSSSYNSWMSQLPTDRLRYIFSYRTWYVYYLTIAAAAITVLSILLAGMLLGDMKNNAYYPPNKYEIVANSV